MATHAWFERYGKTCPGTFRRNAILAMPPGLFPGQLLRNVALALHVRQANEEVIVIALVRQADASSVDVVAHRCLNDGLDVKIRMATWEQIYDALPQRRPLDRVRHYFEHKSYRLRPRSRSRGKRPRTSVRSRTYSDDPHAQSQRTWRTADTHGGPLSQAE